MNYPTEAGHQHGDTDRAAAEHIERSGRAQTLRDQCEDLLRRHPSGMTADEAAVSLRVDKLAIRPRFTELKQRGELVYRGRRRKNASGSSQRVLQHREAVK